MSRAAGIGLKSEGDFFRRHNNRSLSKQKRIKSIKLKGFHLALILIIFATAGLAAFKAGQFFMTWKEFKVKSFKLLNPPPSGADELKEMLKKYSTNIFSLSLTGLRRELLTLREVKDVALSRNLPAAIEIRFYLRKPVFQVLTAHKNNSAGNKRSRKKNTGKQNPGRENMNRYRYDIIDNEGVVLYSTQEKKQGLLTIKNIGEGEWRKILPYTVELNRIKESVEYIGLKKPYGLLLKLKGIKEFFYPGESNFAYKINYYLKLKRLHLLKKYRIKYVDLRFENRFYFEHEPEAGTGAGPQSMNGDETISSRVENLRKKTRFFPMRTTKEAKS
ncbi:MAG: hypothetical protein KAW12_00510 [Candidatus Aminicenantes bacterium]|nr:hypothetical protein [Candidatus Aminicenantes bacterium]